MLMAPENSYNLSWASQDWLKQNSKLKAKGGFCDTMNNLGKELPNLLWYQIRVGIYLSSFSCKGRDS